ncbi:MAG: cyclic nucleotide-binding domain-containing protein [Pseudomonadota bacterium]
MLEALPLPTVILYVAVGLYVMGFLFRNQIVLRALVLTGSSCYVIYYYIVSETPLWDAIIATGLIMASTAYGLINLLLSRSRLAVPWAQLPVLEAMTTFGRIEPGLFRSLMKAGSLRSATEETPLTQEGVPPEALVFLVSGGMRIRKGDVDIVLPGPCFIGEVGWMLGTPASADVHAAEGAEYVLWPRETLRRTIRANPRLETALDALVAHDMARKVAAAAPKARAASADAGSDAAQAAE